MKTKLLLIVAMLCGAFVLVSFQQPGELIPMDPVAPENPAIVLEDQFFNYPDPFSMMTTIEYVVYDESFVCLYVECPNMLDVRVLVHEYQTPGVYKVDFFAIGLPCGTYTAFLKTDYSFEKELMTKINSIVIPPDPFEKE